MLEPNNNKYLSLLKKRANVIKNDLESASLETVVYTTIIAYALSTMLTGIGLLLFGLFKVINLYLL